jgi:thioredoxin 1
MKTSMKVVIVVALIAMVAGAMALKKNPPPAGTTAAASSPAATAKLPKLVDLGADKCIPCKMMAPILEELKKEYAGKMNVEFIDVWKNPDAGKAFGIEMIPTQIFFGAEGKELFRHTGFFGKEDILGKWKELGADFNGGVK